MLFPPDSAKPGKHGNHTLQNQKRGGSHVPEVSQGRLPPHQKQKQEINIYCVNSLRFGEYIAEQRDSPS